MATAGPRLPVSAIINSSIGTEPWDNPGAISSFNTSTYAQATGNNSQTYFLVAYNFGFTLPDDAVPSEIKVEAHRGTEDPPGTVSGTMQDTYVVLLRSGELMTAFNYATDIWSGGPATFSWTGDGLWGQAWSPADLNDVGFGAAFAGVLHPNPGHDVAAAQFYWVRITITYTIFGVEYKQSSLVNFLC